MEINPYYAITTSYDLDSTWKYFWHYANPFGLISEFYAHTLLLGSCLIQQSLPVGKQKKFWNCAEQKEDGQ